MNEQEEDVAVKVEELTLAQITVAYWRDRVETSRKLTQTRACTPEQLCDDLMNLRRAESAARVAEIRLQGAKARLRIEK